MKHIVFIKTIKDHKDVCAISSALDETRAIYTISIPSSSITIEGSNDVLHHAKQLVQGLGYIIE